MMMMMVVVVVTLQGELALYNFNAGGITFFKSCLSRAPVFAQYP